MNSTENIECGLIGNIPMKKKEKPENDITKTSGIYKIVNKINGKYYVGKAKSIKNRWGKHKSYLKHNKHNNLHLQSSWNKYGESNFEFLIIELTEPHPQILKDIEQKYLNIAKTEQTLCYNKNFLSEGGDFYNQLSEEEKKIFKEKVTRYGNHYCSGKNNPSFDKTIYRFYNKITKEIFEGTSYDFYTKYKLIMQNVRQLVRGKRKCVGKWILLF